MQQTEKYKFNLIEMSDTFSPEALNENARAVEDQLAAVRDELAAGDAALAADAAALLAAMGTKGRTCRIQWGEYTGTGKHGKSYPNSLTFDFTPIIVFIQRATSSANAVFLRWAERSHGSATTTSDITWDGLSLSWYNTASSNGAIYQMNTADEVYRWVAIGCDGGVEE